MAKSGAAGYAELLMKKSAGAVAGNANPDRDG